MSINRRRALGAAAAATAAGPELLNVLAEQRGGRAFAVGNLADLPDVAAKIGIELLVPSQAMRSKP